MKRTRSLGLAALLAASLASAASASAQTALSACGGLTKGSYKLTKNLTTTGHCLTLLNNFTTIDLNGFVITGDGDDSDYGIWMTGASPTGIEIRNGTITNFGTAIVLDRAGGVVNGVVIERVRAVRNTGTGIAASNYCILEDNVAAENGDSGLYGGDGCVASGNTASSNGSGLFVGGTAIGNATRDNVYGGGIVPFEGSTVVNNSSQSNVWGIFINCPVNVVGNTATNNSSRNISTPTPPCGVYFNVAP